jgi:hypothetical protein
MPGRPCAAISSAQGATGVAIWNHTAPICAMSRPVMVNSRNHGRMATHTSRTCCGRGMRRALSSILGWPTAIRRCSIWSRPSNATPSSSFRSWMGRRTPAALTSPAPSSRAMSACVRCLTSSAMCCRGCYRSRRPRRRSTGLLISWTTDAG